MLPQVDDLLSDSSTAHATLQVLLKIAEQTPELILEYFASVSNVTKTNPTLVAIVAQILSTAGKVNKVCLSPNNLELTLSIVSYRSNLYCMA